MLDLALEEINVIAKMEINSDERRISFSQNLADILESVKFEEEDAVEDKKNEELSHSCFPVNHENNMNHLHILDSSIQFDSENITFGHRFLKHKPPYADKTPAMHNLTSPRRTNKVLMPIPVPQRISGKTNNNIKTFMPDIHRNSSKTLITSLPKSFQYSSCSAKVNCLNIEVKRRDPNRRYSLADLLDRKDPSDSAQSTRRNSVVDGKYIMMMNEDSGQNDSGFEDMSPLDSGYKTSQEYVFNGISLPFTLPNASPKSNTSSSNDTVPANSIQQVNRAPHASAFTPAILELPNLTYSITEAVFIEETPIKLETEPDNAYITINKPPTYLGERIFSKVRKRSFMVDNKAYSIDADKTRRKSLNESKNKNLSLDNFYLKEDSLYRDSVFRDSLFKEPSSTTYSRKVSRQRKVSNLMNINESAEECPHMENLLEQLNTWKCQERGTFSTVNLKNSQSAMQGKVPSYQSNDSTHYLDNLNDILEYSKDGKESEDHEESINDNEQTEHSKEVAWFEKKRIKQNINLDNELIDTREEEEKAIIFENQYSSLFKSIPVLKEVYEEHIQDDNGDFPDELFLLPDEVLDADYWMVREDLFGLCDTPSGPYVTLEEALSLEDVLPPGVKGLRLGWASDKNSTIWICETGSGMPGVMPASMSQSLDIQTMTQALNPGLDRVDKMTSSMTSSTTSLNKPGRRVLGHRNETSQNWFCFQEEPSTEGRVDLASKEREREERIRRIKEQQEEDRKKKLEELKLHAINAQKFREQQEAERRRHIEDLRSRDFDRRQQVEERRKELERTELERREAILAKNKEREERLNQQRRNSRGNMEFAFGSSAPRMTDQRDSSHWGSRSIFERRSVERDVDLKNKRTASAQALDRNNEGDETGNSFTAAQMGAHRRRTDLIPTILMGRDRGSTPSTPGRAVSMSRIDQLAIPRSQLGKGMSKSVNSKSMSHLALKKTSGQAANRTTGHQRAATAAQPARKPGLSRENSTASRPSSAMSGGGRGQVRLRSAPTRRPRPLSIATTGMTSSTNGMTTSMFEDRQRPQLRNKASATPKMDRMKRAKSVTSEHGIEDDQRSNSSSTASGPINSASTPVRPSSARKTPAQVKAEAAARRSKVIGRAGPPKTGKGSNSVSPALSSDQLHGGGGEGLEEGKRQITPDIIKDNGKKNSYGSISMEGGEEKHDKEGKEEAENEKDEDEKEKEDKPEKKIISSEEEAKAKLAEKRREMKEKKEREAEVERLRLEEEERIEQERLRIEEEEERRMVEETERIASEARRAEEERIQRAIEETEAEEKRVKEEAERSRKEKEESEKRKKEEEEKREADLQEKLKKEEEERQARKKRIEEIMARTRAAKETPTSTPKKEEVESDKPADIPSQPSQPQSLDTNVDPTTPDILGDLSSSVQTENERNLIQNGDEHKDDHSSQNGDHSSQNGGDSASNGDLIKCDSNGELEKGALDSLSNKSEDSQASNKQSSLQSSLIELENGSSKMSALEIEFDEILDLGSEDNKTSSQQPPQPPILAFEPSSQSTDLMS